MNVLNESTCRQGSPSRSIWSAEEARLVKHILNNLAVRLWNKPYTEVDRSDPNGDWCIFIPASVSASANRYTSYFRVIDASEWSAATPPALIACKIGVTNGSAEIADPPVSWCGACKVSGVLANALLTGDLKNKVPAVPNSGAGSISACSGEITAAGEYYVWLHSWIAHDGVWCEARIGDVDDSAAPDNPNGGIGWASQLLGRVTVEDVGGDLTITNITQDYLRGGEHAEEVAGDCEGLELQEPTP